MSEHPWRLVAPWYRWGRYPGSPADTPPVLQKYESSKLVDMMRENPQRSLRFTSEDLVSGRRKLFLALHKRFYLVVCELHCDRPGFPNARGDGVCEAGFVVRRRRTPVPGELQEEATQLLRRIGKRRAQIAMLNCRRERPLAGSPARRTVAVAQAQRAAKAHARAEARLAELRAELSEFAGKHELTQVLEGWAQSPVDGVGSWSRIDGDRPDAGEEHVFPLHRLIPDPEARPHAARGRSLYFGLVPTAVADTEADGTARFDERTGYELHCFVRRHDPNCPRRPGRRDCRGELTWSAPSETFTLATPSDLIGTSNRPVTVQMPDLPDLLEQAAKLPFGAGAPLRMASPEGSGLPANVDSDGKVKGGPLGGIPQICSFAIPLITIIAYFVLRLFLPIVVLAFGLWALLRLKFCIPPSVDLGVDMSLELQASKGGASLDAGVAATAVAALNLPFDPTNPAAPHMPGSGYDDMKFGDEMQADGFSAADLVQYVMEQQRGPDDPVFAPHPQPPAGALPSPNALLAPLLWEEELPIPELEEAA